MMLMCKFSAPVFTVSADCSAIVCMGLRSMVMNTVALEQGGRKATTQIFMEKFTKNLILKFLIQSS